VDNRQQFGYPPFTRIILLVFKHKEKHIAEEAAHLMMQGLAANFSKEISGPAQPVVDRVRNQYLWEVFIKLPKDMQRINQCKREIMQQMVMIQSNKRYRAVRIIINVDPL
jgi:primosomal protein N' (replication factor Y) (superfamily II helicase)